jgi:hypothetical protein
MSYFKGNYEEIFKSKDFRNSQVFEDDPWWLSDFYRVLYHRFPKSKFILLERDADKWFDSMVSHSKGKTPGVTHIHCTQYQRLKEFHEAGPADKNFYTGTVDNLLPLGEEQREHYTSFYKIRNKEVKLFFQHHDIRRLFHARLEDNELWHKMGQFFGITVDSAYKVHLNKSEMDSQLTLAENCLILSCTISWHHEQDNSNKTISPANRRVPPLFGKNLEQ